MLFLNFEAYLTIKFLSKHNLLVSVAHTQTATVDRTVDQVGDSYADPLPHRHESPGPRGPAGTDTGTATDPSGTSDADGTSETSGTNDESGTSDSVETSADSVDAPNLAETLDSDGNLGTSHDQAQVPLTVHYVTSVERTASGANRNAAQVLEPVYEVRNDNEGEGERVLLRETPQKSNVVLVLVSAQLHECNSR